MMELPMSSGQFQLSGMDVVESMSAIHPSQLSIPSVAGQHQININTLNIPSPSHQQISPVNQMQQQQQAGNNNINNVISTSNMGDLSNSINCYTGGGGGGMSISSHISSLMADPCIFTGVWRRICAIDSDSSSSTFLVLVTVIVKDKYNSPTRPPMKSLGVYIHT